MKVFLTGPPNTGKELIIQFLMTKLNIAGGFLTIPIYRAAICSGYALLPIKDRYILKQNNALDERYQVFADKNIVSPYRSGRFGVNISVLERHGVESIGRALLRSGVIVLDSIENIHTMAPTFRKAILSAVNSKEHDVLGTLGSKKNKFIKSIYDTPNVFILELNRFNFSDILNITASLFGLNKRGLTSTEKNISY